MRHRSSRRPEKNRIRPALEALEVRLPVSETIGAALAMTTLSSFGEAIARRHAPEPAPTPSRPEAAVGQTAPRDTTPANLLATVSATATLAPLSYRGPTLDPIPFGDWAAQDTLDPLGSAAKARPDDARPGFATDAPAGNLGSAPAAPGVPPDAARAAANPVGTGAVAGPQGAGANVFLPAAPAANPVPEGESAGGAAGPRAPAVGVGSYNTPTFHGDRARTGWDANETVLTPGNVAPGQFGNVWNSPVLDSYTVGSNTYKPHLYASPLYLDNVHITAGTYAGNTVGVVFAATSTGFVYAIKAFDTAGTTTIPAGTILWRRGLGQPTPTIDGGVTVGVLSTPVIDTASNRIYVTSDVTDGTGRNWDVFALDLGSGNVLPGWPLQVNGTTLAPINQNGPTTWEGTAAESQRGALNLSPDGSLLYVPFGAYGDGGAGWMVAVKTTGTPALASAFAGAPTNVAFANGGMWGAGGPAVDAGGNVVDTTGNSPSGSGSTPHVWGNSFLQWSPGTPLALNGTYTPWNYNQMDQNDTDLGGGSPIVIDLDPATTSTPHLSAFGGKQGNAYLVDRANLRGSLTARQAPSTDSSTDTSLLPPGNQPQFGRRGPLNIFGPYSEDSNQVDYAKARTTPAYFKGADGSNYVVYSGSAKVAVNSVTPLAPSVVVTKIVTSPGQPAYLAETAQNTVAMKLAGAPVVSSNGTASPIVWVVDANVMRTDSLTSPTAGHPVLYAFDALTMRLLWNSAANELDVGGKYNQPTVTRGTVFVGTDRIQAFGPLTGPVVTTVDDSVVGTGPNQINYVGAWTHVTGTTIPNCYDGTVSYTDTTNDTATIAFTGTQVKFYVARRNNRGIAAVSVDGGAETNVDEYAAADAGNVLAYTSPTLAAGTHTFKVRNTGTHNAGSSGTRVDIDRIDLVSNPAPTVTTVDDAVQGTGPNQVNYVGGGWGHVVGTVIPNAFDGTVSLTATTNAYATIAFTGTQIKFYAGERNNRGIAAVSVDGGAETNVDLYSATDAGDVLVYTSPTLTAGSHTFKVRNTGTHDAGSAGTNICIDRFDILS